MATLSSRQAQWLFYQSRWPFYQVLSTMAALSRSRTRPVAAMAVLSSRSGQIARSARFGLRIADFILPRRRSLSAAKPSHFFFKGWQAIGSFMKAGQPQWPFYQRRWPFYQGRPASIAVLATVAALSRPGQRPQRPHGQISRFRLRMADFIFPRTSSLPTAKSSHF